MVPTAPAALVEFGKAVSIAAPRTPAWVGGAWERGAVPARRGRHGALRAAEGAGEAEPKEDDGDDTTNVDLFRQSLIQGWGGGGVGSAAPDTSDDWAELLAPDAVKPGDVLLADPMWFVGEDPDLPRNGPRRVGLGDRLPSFMGPREISKWLPVILLTKVDEGSGVAEGVTLNLRTGKLMGDFINHFHSRPLLFGGPTEAGLLMVHPYPQVPESSELSDSGLYMGGDFAGAQDWVEEGEGSSLRFRFFMNLCRWQRGELAKELASLDDASAPGSAPFMAVRVSTNLALAEVDSIEDKPLWVRIAELAGGEAREAGRRFELLD